MRYAKPSVHLGGLRLKIFIEGDFKVEQLFAVGIPQLIQIKLGVFQRMVELRHIVEEKSGTRGVRLDNKRSVLKRIEVRLNVLIAGLRFELDGWDRAGHWNLSAFTLFARHQPF